MGLHYKWVCMNTFESDGLLFIEDVLSNKELLDIRKESSYLFSKNIMSGHGFSVQLSPFRKEISQPLSKIYSINLFEKIIKISEKINDLVKEKEYVLAHAALYSESKNKFPLHWHSDERDGALIRVQLCIKGSTERSGAFKYVIGSHAEEKHDYLPSSEYISRNSNKIVIAPEANGSATVINTEGYHAKSICIDERISIMLDFLPREYIENNPADCVSSINIRNDQLTSDVISNLHFLNIGPRELGISNNTPRQYEYSMYFGGFFNRFAFIWKLRRWLSVLRAGRR